MKDWRKWDEFEKKIRCLRQKEASQTITNIIEAKYIELKTYLQEQLDMAKPLAQEAVREVIKEHGDSNETSDSDNIVMQIECTRKQLNELVITQPIPGVEVDKVFKVAELVPSSVSYPKCLPIESILNWYNVRITIDTKTLSYQRMTNHQMKHVLVNMKLGPRVHTRVLKRHMQVKEADELTTEVMNKERIYKFFNKLLLNETVQSSDQKTILLALTEVMKKDLNGMETVKAPATYRQYSARYPYYRIFKREVDRALSTDGDQLYMEETIAPVHVFLIGKATLNIKSKRKMNFTLECMECKVKFSGNEMCARVTEHFETMHLSEPNWNCTNCEDTFPMFELARNKWQHECSQM